MTKVNYLGDAYATTLAHIRVQKGGRSRPGMDALIMVLDLELPLQTSELCYALGAKIGSVDLGVENLPTILIHLRGSFNLIKVMASSSTVRRVHFTPREYLTSNNPSLLQSPHLIIGEVCLTCLNFRCVQELPPTLGYTPPALLLAGYAPRYRGERI